MGRRRDFLAGRRLLFGGRGNGLGLFRGGPTDRVDDIHRLDDAPHALRNGLHRAVDFLHLRLDGRDTSGDVLELLADLADGLGTQCHLVGARLHGNHRFLGVALDHRDAVLDFLRRSLGLLGQLADFLRDHGESAACLAGARRLDGRVQRQEVRLVGNRRDAFHNLPNLLRVLAQLPDHLRGVRHALLDAVHLVHGVVHELRAMVRRRRHLLGVLPDDLGLLRHGLHISERRIHMLLRAVHAVHLLVHAAGDLDDGLRHMGGRLRRLLGSGRQLLGAGRNLLRAVGNLLHQLLDRVHHAVVAIAQLGQLVVAFQLYLVGQVALRHLLGYADQFLQRALDGADQEPRGKNRDDDRDSRRAHGQRLGVRDIRLDAVGPDLHPAFIGLQHLLGLLVDREERLAARPHIVVLGLLDLAGLDQLQRVVLPPLVVRPKLFQIRKVLLVPLPGLGADVFALLQRLAICHEELLDLDQLRVHLLDALVDSLGPDQRHCRVAARVRRVHGPAVHVLHHRNPLFRQVVHFTLHRVQGIDGKPDITEKQHDDKTKTQKQPRLDG